MRLQHLSMISCHCFCLFVSLCVSLRSSSDIVCGAITFSFTFFCWQNLISVAETFVRLLSCSCNYAKHILLFCLIEIQWMNHFLFIRQLFPQRTYCANICVALWANANNATVYNPAQKYNLQYEEKSLPSWRVLLHQLWKTLVWRIHGRWSGGHSLGCFPILLGSLSDCTYLNFMLALLHLSCSGDTQSHYCIDTRHCMLIRT